MENSWDGANDSPSIPVANTTVEGARFRYLCHACGSITERDSQSLICAHCGSDFVEENPSQDIEHQYANDGETGDDDDSPFTDFLAGRLPLGSRPLLNSDADGDGDGDREDGQGEHLPGEFPSRSRARRNFEGGSTAAQNQTDILAALPQGRALLVTDTDCEEVGRGDRIAGLLQQHVGSSSQVLVRTVGPDGRATEGAVGSGSTPSGVSTTETTAGPSVIGPFPGSFMGGNGGRVGGGEYPPMYPLLSALFSEFGGRGTAGGGNGSGSALFRLLGGVGNPADYAHGRQLDDVITQLMEEAARQQAPPP
ncbi:hypothetical protein HDU93_007355 [Gonapodya sp. JEL0774]|nr:hypothetical protein HDU93_007355 [Gonapodya sp. JEL0774]